MSALLSTGEGYMYLLHIANISRLFALSSALSQQYLFKTYVNLDKYTSEQQERQLGATASDLACHHPQHGTSTRVCIHRLISIKSTKKGSISSYRPCHATPKRMTYVSI